MALPVTGPIVKSDDSAPWEFYYESQRWKQAKPYDRPLPYYAKHAKCTRYYFGTNLRYAVCVNAFPANPSLWQSFEANQAKQKAYSKFLGMIGDRASMGENLGQLGSSVRLVVEKLVIVREAIRRLRRFDVSAFAAWMDRGFLKRNSRFASQLTLELNFAIIPSINDIYSAIDILQKPVPPQMIKGRASVPYQREYLNSSPGSKNQRYSLKVSAEYGATVQVTNRNLYLANALGLANPVQTAWQLLPGSFLVDWFIPVEQFLGMATDFWGLTLTNQYTSVFSRGDYLENWTAYPGSPETAYNFVVKLSEMKRELGFTLPNLVFKPLKTPSMKRAANAAALVIQAFYK